MTDLYLFDIDGTLVDSMNAHYESFRRTYLEAFGINVERELMVKNFGRTAVDFTKSVFAELGLKFSMENYEKIISIWHKHFLAVLKKEKTIVLSGAFDFLEELKQKKIPAGVITGNPESVGSLLLENSGLRAYFEFECYTKKTTKIRADLIFESVKKAKEKGYAIENVVVIGDTPIDIEAANASGSIAVGVATGHYKKECLKKAGAAIALESLDEYPLIFRVTGS